MYGVWFEHSMSKGLEDACSSLSSSRSDGVEIHALWVSIWLDSVFHACPAAFWSLLLPSNRSCSLLLFCDLCAKCPATWPLLVLWAKAWEFTNRDFPSVIGGRLCVSMGGRLWKSLLDVCSTRWTFSDSLFSFLTVELFSLSSLANGSAKQSNIVIMSSTSDVSSFSWHSWLKSVCWERCSSFFFLLKIWFSMRNFPSLHIEGSLIWACSGLLDSDLWKVWSSLVLKILQSLPAFYMWVIQELNKCALF